MTEYELRENIKINLIKFCFRYTANTHDQCDGCPLLADGYCLKNIIISSDTKCLKKWKDLKKKS